MLVPSSANLSELGFFLQDHTQQHLYIEKNELKSLDNPEELNGKFRYASPDSEDLPVLGWRLQNCETGEYLEIFSETLVEYLISDTFDEPSSTNSSSFSPISSSNDVEMETSYFRMYIKTVGETDDEGIYINPQVLKHLEEKNQIDLSATIQKSFTMFLQERGFLYNEINVIFHEGVFGEVEIKTKLPMSQEVLITLENGAKLRLDDDVLYFRLRFLDSKYNRLETIYSDQIDLSDLPDPLQLKILDRIMNIEKETTFDYNNFRIKIKNEGDNMYSVFDLDLQFSMPHLDPFYYPNVEKYEDLPIAQFII